MEVTTSKLRENIYNIIDKVLESGVPVYIKRKGKTLKISVEGSTDKLNRLKELPKRPVIVGDPDSLVHVDWSTEWKHDLP